MTAGIERRVTHLIEDRRPDLKISSLDFRQAQVTEGPRVRDLYSHS